MLKSKLKVSGYYRNRTLTNTLTALRDAIELLWFSLRDKGCRQNQLRRLPEAYFLRLMRARRLGSAYDRPYKYWHGEDTIFLCIRRADGTMSVDYRSPRALIEAGPVTIPELFEWNARQNPDYPLFRFPNNDGALKTITYAAAIKAIRHVARHILALVRSTERCAVALLANAGMGFPAFAFIEKY